MNFSQEASPLHRHQASLEGVTSLANLMEVSSLVGGIDVTTEPPLGTEQRSAATGKFHRIVDYFNTRDLDTHGPGTRRYNRAQLIGLTHQYAITEQSRDSVLRAFFRAMTLSIDDNNEDDNFKDLGSNFFSFADFLFDNFFLPVKASTRRTPQPTPNYYSAVQEAQGVTQGFVGTPARVSALRGQCLIRDHHRCVVSRLFDMKEMTARLTNPNQPAIDDEDELLAGQAYTSLEVAHILPHSLMKANPGYQPDTSREAALMVLNMFDYGVVHLIEGDNINRPINALTLSRDYHLLFGGFTVYFEPINDAPPHTYKINSFLPVGMNTPIVPLPITRTLFFFKEQMIDPPSPRLLAIHRAIAHILHLSEAGEYIDKILKDGEKTAIPADGSLEIGHLVRLGLEGWRSKDTMCT